jgi:LPS-assembly lipoprotein
MDRRGAITLLAGLTLAAGCGFAPVYDTGGRGIGPVEIGLIEGRTGHLLRQELLRRASLERGEGPPRVLVITLAFSFVNTNQQSTGFFNRTQMTVDASYTLTGTNPDAPDATGKVTAMVGYDTLNQAFTDVSLQADAEERIAVMLADRLWADLATRAARR